MLEAPRSESGGCGGDSCDAGPLVRFRVDDAAPGLVVAQGADLGSRLFLRSQGSGTFRVYQAELNVALTDLYVATVDEAGFRSSFTRVVAESP